MNNLPLLEKVTSTKLDGYTSTVYRYADPSNKSFKILVQKIYTKTEMFELDEMEKAMIYHNERKD